MKDFLNYFKNQWIDSQLKKWQIFDTPSGFAGTNSPIESFNKTIKSRFTDHLKLNIVPALEIFTSLIEYASKQRSVLGLPVKVNNEMDMKARSR
jgi:hypothetical protein